MMIAVIDVGSNAVRMALGSTNRSEIHVVKSFRAPIRLGADSFTNGKISEESISRLVDTFNVFQDIIRQSKVSITKAVATSAVRECTNKRELIQRVQKEAQIDLEIINEEEEARLIHLAVIRDQSLQKKRTLITDIGGGSIEFIQSLEGEMKSYQSLKLGTVRMFQMISKLPQHEQIPRLREEVAKGLKKIVHLKRFFDVDQDDKIFVGTGGNVRTMHRLSKEFFRNPRKEAIGAWDFAHLTKLVSTYSYEERIKELDLRKDRADVILPALVVLEETMKLFGFTSLRTPKVGLKDGLLYDVGRKASKR